MKEREDKGKREGEGEGKGSGKRVKEMRRDLLDQC